MKTLFNQSKSTMKVLWILILFIFPPVAANAQFGFAADCNVNVVCEPDWCNRRRSVGLIYKLVDGVYVRSGTGSLITNERRDGVSPLSSGTYYCRIYKKDQYIVKKFIKL